MEASPGHLPRRVAVPFPPPLEGARGSRQDLAGWKSLVADAEGVGPVQEPAVRYRQRNQLRSGNVQVGMSSTRRTRIRLAIVLAVAAAVLGGNYILRPVAFHALPYSVTGEDARLAEVLRLSPGMTVAEIGAGRGVLAAAIARRLEPGGQLYATELSTDRLRELRRRVEREGIGNMLIVEAGETQTNLPDACCDAVFMRNVYHHIGDPAAFNTSLRRSIRDGGLLAIIDFPPSVFWSRSASPDGAAPARTGHGVTPHEVVEELERAGFRLERTIENWGGHTFLVLFRAVSDQPSRSGRLLWLASFGPQSHRATS
jgi:SAM-dependent methyltransferase